MSDVSMGHEVPINPPCPVCGGRTILAEKHKAVAKVTDVFLCTHCGVEYPVMRKRTGKIR